MKSLTIFLALLFSVMFSSSSYAGWTKVSGNDIGDNFYVDFERMRKVDGSVYFWYLADYLTPIVSSYLSVKSYHQGDCKLFRYKRLSVTAHKEQMGGGIGDKFIPDKEWDYPSPNSVIEIVIKSVCNR